MKKMELRDGHIFLDGEKVENLKRYKISNPVKGIAELEMVIDVSIGRDRTGSEN